MWAEKVNGKTVFRERVTDPVTGRSRKFSVTAKKETAAAYAEARKKLYSKINAETNVEAHMRMSELVALYIDDQAATLKDSTKRRNENTLVRFTRILSDPFVDKLNAGYVRRCLLSLGKGPETMNEYLRRFRTFWRWAYRNNYVGSSAVADQLENFKTQPHRLRIQDKYLEASEALEVIDRLQDDYKLVARFMLLTGVRFGELSALNRMDVKKDVIEIYKTRDAITGDITETKTQSSTRQIHITPELSELLKEVFKFMDYRRKITETKCPALFLNQFGERVNMPSFNKAFKIATKAVTGRELTSHALRHSYASFLMQNDIPLPTIQRVLGHQSSEVTKRIYLHVTEELKRKDNAALDAISLLK